VFGKSDALTIRKSLCLSPRADWKFMHNTTGEDTQLFHSPDCWCSRHKNKDNAEQVNKSIRKQLHEQNKNHIMADQSDTLLTFAKQVALPSESIWTDALERAELVDTFCVDAA
jgi:hypothetical protein